MHAATLTPVSSPTPPPAHVVEDILRDALDEDLGAAGDLTSNALVPAEQLATARIVARAPGTVAGLEASAGVFELLDGEVAVSIEIEDGTTVGAMTTLASLDGSARAILTGERTCLNLLGHLSGIATVTRQIVDSIAHTDASVADTRKTTPGLRALEKYAVRCGGGRNHRFGLHDAVMIKDNHLRASSSIGDAVARARAAVGHTVIVELEVDRLDQVPEALEAGVDVILLDNMSPDELREAVSLVDDRATTEASGGITAESAAAIAESGVDVISVGWITHSAPRLDVALDF